MSCTPFVPLTRVPALLAVLALFLLPLGCGGDGDKTDGGSQSRPESHWYQQKLIAALDTLMESDARKSDMTTFATTLGYELLGPDTSWKRERDDIASRITWSEREIRGTSKSIQTLELTAWVGDGRGSTLRDIEIVQPRSDEIAKALEEHFGDADEKLKPTGSQSGQGLNRRRSLIWVRGPWKLIFDPAAFRSTCVLKVVHNGAWKPSDMDSSGRGVVERRDDPGSTGPGTTGSGSARDRDNAGNGGTSSNSGSSRDRVFLPSDRGEDNAAAMRIHERFVGAASRKTSDHLRDRRVRYRDRTWLIADADVAGVHVVGGGSSEATWKWDVMDGDLRLQLYGLVDDKTPADILGIAVTAYRESLDVEGDELVYRVFDRHEDRAADIHAFLARQRGIRTQAFTPIREGRQWRWMTARQMEDRKEAAEIEEYAKRLEKNLRSSRDDARQDAEWVINRMAGMGDDARLRALEVVMDERASRMSRLGRTHISGSVARRLKQTFDLARRDAMEAIYDKEAYPYPSDTHEGQDQVDELVGTVRTMWENPAKALLEANPDLGDLVDEVRELEDYIRQLDPGSIGAAQDAAGAFEQAVNDLVDMETVTSGAAEKSRYKQFEEFERDNNEGESIATEEERAFVSILNAYRKMMGVGPLRLNDHLTEASRAHSEYMASSGEFAHEIDGHPHGRSPRERGSKFGYGGNVSENIFMGSSAAQSAFDGWFGSSGHHRNMLDPRWRVVGAGQANGRWTTMFGAAEDGSEPKARR